MFRVPRFDQHHVQSGMQALVDSYDAKVIEIKNPIEVQDDFGSMNRDYDSSPVIFQGEALIRPVSGTVQRYGLGEIEHQVLSVLIYGNPDIRQGYFAKIEERLYQVTKTAPYLDSFIVLDLEQFEQ